VLRNPQFPGILEVVFGAAEEGLVDDGGKAFFLMGKAVAEGGGVFVEDVSMGLRLGSKR
jgi:hypothetical protein